MNNGEFREWCATFVPYKRRTYNCNGVWCPSSSLDAMRNVELLVVLAVGERKWDTALWCAIISVHEIDACCHTYTAKKALASLAQRREAVVSLKEEVDAVLKVETWRLHV